MKEEKTIVIDIRLTKELVVALIAILATLIVLVYPTLAGGSAAASGKETSENASLPSSTGMRQFYLTQATFQGNQPLTACAAGYHFASFWEIAEPSNLKYNTTLGYIHSDSGQGPTSGIFGWVRTGYISGNTLTPGKANCESWTSPSASDMGSVSKLPHDWSDDNEVLGVWVLGGFSCNAYNYVWCIED